MKKLYTLFFMLVAFGVNAQTEWTGPTITITKADFADWTLPANQDMLTANVILTRADNRGIFNIAVETEFDNYDYLSPLDTEWAIGSIADGVGTLTFDTWDNTHGADPTSVVGTPQVLHLITDDIYIDITVTSWTQGPNSGGAGGGGFSYDRSTDNSLGADEFEQLDIKLFPNPSSEYIQISGLKSEEFYSIYNILGAEVRTGSVSNEEEIDIKNFNNGLYFLKFENGNTLKFVKS